MTDDETDDLERAAGREQGLPDCCVEFHLATRNTPALASYLRTVGVGIMCPACAGRDFP